MLNLDAARVRDHVVSSGDALGSRVRRSGGPMLWVIFLLTVTLQLAARRACYIDIIPHVRNLITRMSNLVRPAALEEPFATFSVKGVVVVVSV